MNDDVCDGYGDYFPENTLDNYTTFREHLNKVSKDIDRWPEWKKACIGSYDARLDRD